MRKAALINVRKPQCIGANKKIRMANSTMHYGSILDFIFSDFEDKRKNRANVPWLICFASTRTLESAPFSSRETFSRGREAANAIFSLNVLNGFLTLKHDEYRQRGAKRFVRYPRLHRQYEQGQQSM